MSAGKLVPFMDSAIWRDGAPSTGNFVLFQIDGPRLPVVGGTLIWITATKPSEDGGIDCVVGIDHRGAVYECDWQCVFVEASE